MVHQNEVDFTLLKKMKVNRSEELDPPQAPLSSALRDAQQAMTVLFSCFECNKNTTVDEMDKVMDVQKLLRDRVMRKLCHSKITEYINTQ